MDCCRSAKRLGATDVKVIARKTRKYFKASPWELEDAEEEARRDRREPPADPLHHRERHADRHGVRAVQVDGNRRQARTGSDRHASRIPCDTVVLAIGQDNAFPWIERDHRPRLRQEVGHADRRQDDVHVDAARACSSAATRRSGRPTSSGRSSTATRRRSRSTTTARACRSPSGRRTRMSLTSTKMGLHEWSYSNNYDPSQRAKMRHVDMPRRFQNMTIEVEQGFTAGADEDRGRALPQLRRRDALHRLAVHRVRRVHRHLPDRLPDDRAERRRKRDLSTAADGAAHRAASAALRLERAEADRPRDGEGRERVRALRAVRRALSDLRMGHAQVRGEHPDGGAGHARARACRPVAADRGTETREIGHGDTKTNLQSCELSALCPCVSVAD